MVESASLENWYAVYGIGGSNPPLSAIWDLDLRLAVTTRIEMAVAAVVAWQAARD